MKEQLKLLMAQINPIVGDIEGNQKKIMAIIEQEQAQHDLIIFPELCLTGYPPEDLLLRPEFYQRTERAVEQIQHAVKDCYVIIGYPSALHGVHFNSAALLGDNKRKIYHKQLFPNYGVFDEKRYFAAGKEIFSFSCKGYHFGLCICEDLWQKGPVEELAKLSIDCLICINASPFDYQKLNQRIALLTQRSSLGFPVVYVNLVGGQDELIFDGQSMVMNQHGIITALAPAFQEALETITLEKGEIFGQVTRTLSQEQLIYEALVLGTRDYVEKNRFPGVILGLSGGIDSALTLAIAVDALGPERVQVLMMPSRYTAGISNEDAQQQINALGVQGQFISIEPIFNEILSSLTPLFGHRPIDITEENIQARIRGVLLMALSNKLGPLVLVTSNKSESAVGYATLYGDMAGGFAPLKDVLKTQVYALAHYRNSISPVIPERVIDRPPSAELAPDQKDQDSLPEYHLVDAIIQGYMENNLSIDDLLQQGLPLPAIEKVVRLIKRSEYKRRQSAPGIKISARAFGKDWRYPITSRF